MTNAEKQLFKMLSSSCGCGDEKQYADFLVKELEKTGFCTEIKSDRFNNVSALIKGKSDYTLLLEAHYDEISAVVSQVTEEGFLRIRNVGGVDRRTLLASQVSVEGLDGVFCSVPPHLMEKGDDEKVPEYDELYIDLGLSYDEVVKKIKVGSRVSFLPVAKKLMGSRVSARALDNRVCVFAILSAVNKLKKEIDAGNLDISVRLLFSTQEEIGGNGAKVGLYDLYPDEALVLDVNFAKQPLTKIPRSALGSGAIIESSAYFDRRIVRKLLKIAQEKKIPYTVNVETVASGTNSDLVSVTRQGIFSGALSLPLRYMHTPVETVDMKDIDALASLIKEYIKEGAMWSC